MSDMQSRKSAWETRMHELELSDRFCAIGLKYIDCRECDHSWLAEIGIGGHLIDKVLVAQGNPDVMHIYRGENVQAKKRQKTAGSEV